MNIGTWLERRAAKSPEQPAVFEGQKLLARYSEFEQAVRRLAQGLVEQGIKPNDRVAIVLKNTPQYLTVLYAIWYAGAVAVPINAKLHAKEVSWILADSEAVLTFTSGELTGELATFAPQSRVMNIESKAFETLTCSDMIMRCALRQPTDLAWLFYTSGTTGQPKGVMITHRMLVSMSLCYLADVDHVTGNDTALYAAPMSHGAGLYNMVHVLKGAQHVFPQSGGFDPDEIFDLAEHFGSVHMFAAPTMVKRMSGVARNKKRSGQGLRSVIYAGGPMYNADIIEAVTLFGDVFIQIYGQGECPMGITALSREDVADRTRCGWKERLASVGTPQSGIEVRIGDDFGEELRVGDVGEIMVRGDTVMGGYWKNAAATSKTLVNGWLLTGDMGKMDRAGYVTLVDRSKDVIISGGTNIYPREVEEVLLSHPSVTEVSVIGKPHPEWGEEVIAFVVVEDDFLLDRNALDEHCLKSIARFKRPKRYVQISTLPKNNYGKVLKTQLRDHRIF